MSHRQTRIYSLKEVVDIAVAKSPYYKNLYSGCALGAILRSPDLSSLPVVDQKKFWAANTMDNNQLLTADTADGVVFRSGGTTGSPKFSIFTRQEWNTFTEIFGQGMAAGGLRRGEKIANYFYGGALYASFLFIYKSLEYASVSTVQYPIAGGTDPLDALKMIQDFGIGTIAGVPTGIMTLAQTYQAHKKDFPKLKIDRLLFGGESMQMDQRRLLTEIFPGVTIASIGYASVDAGLLGYADPSCGIDEHRVFGDSSVIEIVDQDTNLVIQDKAKPGRVLITNLTRTLMPIIRYPAGDIAEWVDDPRQTSNPRFKLLGRGEEAARVGPVSLYFDDLDHLISPHKPRLGISGFQMEVFHRDERDGLILRIAVADPGRVGEADTTAILEALFAQRPMLRDWVTTNKVHATTIEWVRHDQLSTNGRTGKMKRIIDLRF
jgi:phenylacetate-CoA ligase